MFANISQCEVNSGNNLRSRIFINLDFKGEKKDVRKNYRNVSRSVEDGRSSIDPEKDLKEDLGVDSLDLFEFIMACEEEFDVEIDT